jgi:hypothetical protein
VNIYYTLHSFKKALEQPRWIHDRARLISYRGLSRLGVERDSYLDSYMLVFFNYRDSFRELVGDMKCFLVNDCIPPSTVEFLADRGQ